MTYIQGQIQRGCIGMVATPADHTMEAAAEDFLKSLNQIRIAQLSLHVQWHIPCLPIPLLPPSLLPLSSHVPSCPHGGESSRAASAPLQLGCLGSQVQMGMVAVAVMGGFLSP